VNTLLNQQADTMQAAQAAGQVVAQGIGAYADMKRDDAVAALQAAKDRGDTAGMAAALVDYNNWREGGDSRAELHAAGGALIGGLGGGSAFSTIGGAAGAGMSSLLAPQTKAFSDAVSDATGSSLIGNLAGNIASGIGGAIMGGTAGAAGASNVNLYNQGNNKDEDKARHLVEQAIGVPPGATTGQSIGSLVDQFIGMVKGGAAEKMSESSSDLVAQGVANGLNAVVGTGGGKPPAASPGVVLADSTAANAVPGTPGHAPSNAILNNDGGGDVQQGASKSSGDAARLTGQQREETVANIVNGATSGEKVAVPGIGSTDIDVVAPNGDLIAVGGPAKANNLGKLGQELRIYQTIADQRGVSAQVYFAEGTPQSAINLATKILGEANVKIFSGSK
jgi:filamentous hemagglutinin